MLRPRRTLLCSARRSTSGPDVFKYKGLHISWTALRLVLILLSTVIITLLLTYYVGITIADSIVNL